MLTRVIGNPPVSGMLAVSYGDWHDIQGITDLSYQQFGWPHQAGTVFFSNKSRAIFL